MKILVTGANGFVGKNLIANLKLYDHEVVCFDRTNDQSELFDLTKDCEFVYHLAGVNRPETIEEFYEGNSDLTQKLCDALEKNGNNCPLMISSSVQAVKDNDYGKSKKAGEKIVLAHGNKLNSKVYIFRFKNLFGKWAKPNYNSVVATWCHNIARENEIRVDDREVELELCYIDDVVETLIKLIELQPESGYLEVQKTYKISLGALENLLKSFRATRENNIAPDQSSELNKKLYATYLSYLPEDKFNYALKTHTDERGSFTEFIKFSLDGQVSVNVSNPGIIKGQHWHNTKNEKFLVVNGQGIIRFREINSDKIIEYFVNGKKLEVIDVPVGYTHNIENTGDEELITLIWANEQFDSSKPDTNRMEV